MNQTKFYQVSAKCGHVGKGKYIEVDFAVKASSSKEAASIVKVYPRVKKHLKDVISNVSQIDLYDYIELLNENNKDPYLKCTSIQQQNCIEDLEKRIVEVDYNLKNRKKDKKHYLKKVRQIANYYDDQIKEYFKGYTFNEGY